MKRRRGRSKNGEWRVSRNHVRSGKRKRERRRKKSKKTDINRWRGELITNKKANSYKVMLQSRLKLIPTRCILARPTGEHGTGWKERETVQEIK